MSHQAQGTNNRIRQMHRPTNTSPSVHNKHNLWKRRLEQLVHFGSIGGTCLERNVVLLLFDIDEEEREQRGCSRFELLALKGISDTDHVGNLLEQVSHYGQEIVLRQQSYKGILTTRSSSAIVTSDQLVAKHCPAGKNIVVVGVPQGSNIIECTRRAIQLLSEPVIQEKLKRHHFEYQEWLSKRTNHVQFRRIESMGKQHHSPRPAGGLLSRFWKNATKSQRFGSVDTVDYAEEDSERMSI